MARQDFLAVVLDVERTLREAGNPKFLKWLQDPRYKDPMSLKFAELQASYTLTVSLLGSKWLRTIVDAISGCPLAVKLAAKVYLRRHNNFMAENYGPLALFTLYTNYAKVTSTAVKAAAAATKAAAVRAAASAAMTRAKIVEDISIAAAARAAEAAGAERAAADIEAKVVATVFPNLATSESSVAGVVTTQTVTTVVVHSPPRPSPLPPRKRKWLRIDQGTRGGGCLQQHSANTDAIDADTLPAETLGIEAPHSPPKQARSEYDDGKDNEEETITATAEPVNLPLLGACDPPRTGPIASTPKKGCNEVPEPTDLDLSGLSIGEPMLTGEYEQLIKELSFSEFLREYGVENLPESQPLVWSRLQLDNEQQQSEQEPEPEQMLQQRQEPEPERMLQQWQEPEQFEQQQEPHQEQQQPQQQQQQQQEQQDVRHDGDHNNVGVIQVGYGAVPNESRIRVNNETVRFVRRFNAFARDFNVDFLPAPPGIDEIEWLRGALEEIHRVILDKCEEDEDYYIGVKMSSDTFVHGQGWLPVRHKRLFSTYDLWRVFGGIAQSNREAFCVDDSLILTATYFKLPRGRGFNLKKIRRALKVQSLVEIRNNDGLCLPRSLACALVYMKDQNTKSWDKEWRQIYRNESPRDPQKAVALKLCEAAGVNVTDAACGMDHLDIFQEYFYRESTVIVVYSKGTVGDGVGPIYDGRILFEALGKEWTNRVNLSFDENEKHFDLILDLYGVRNHEDTRRHYCERCNLGFCEPFRHRNCPEFCDSCHARPECKSDGNAISCRDCRREFVNQQCFERHRSVGSYSFCQSNQAKKTICEQVKYCTDCRCLWYKARGRVHSCDEIFCKSCKSRHSPNHLCHIRTRASKTTTTTPSETHGVSQCKPKNLFVFYDFEATQNTVYRQVGESYEYIHKVDLCVAQSCCDACLRIDDMSYICNFCGPRQRTMSSENPVAELLDFVLRKQTDFERITAICHNSRSYDGQFILRELYDHHIVKGSDKTPEVIANGRKIVCLTFGKVRFIDSLSYLPMKLADLSAAFDLPVMKGYFPHKFNTLENMNHNGEWPKADDYCPESISPDENAKFFAWYETVKSGTFNMREELKTYCTADVTLLRQASLRFREIFMEATNVCPFTEAITIAGACAAAFRTTFMTDETIGIIPNGGYVRADRQSRKAIEWLLWKEREYPGIKHAANGREHRLFNRIPVDGFLAREGQPDLVLQFHGCFYHGCRTCNPLNRHRSLKDRRSMAQRYEETNVTQSPSSMHLQRKEAASNTLQRTHLPLISTATSVPDCEATFKRTSGVSVPSRTAKFWLP
ncbi:hypothetical protein QAD02_021048 [Eretmocerus hayati]|uniref:Uncharacterized protein n=1 Tax=Eretmocerus hayati TaxID=131215 RepID=A0ACC2PNS5_9HYME|nr:hypothetical protein QAD02_021048 [Eretmocerus hayati]